MNTGRELTKGTGSEQAKRQLCVHKPLARTFFCQHHHSWSMATTAAELLFYPSQSELGRTVPALHSALPNDGVPAHIIQ